MDEIPEVNSDSVVSEFTIQTGKSDVSETEIQADIFISLPDIIGMRLSQWKKLERVILMRPVEPCQKYRWLKFSFSGGLKDEVCEHYEAGSFERIGRVMEFIFTCDGIITYEKWNNFRGEHIKK